MPIGTGPYEVKDFHANDIVVYATNDHYRVADQPHFAGSSSRAAVTPQPPARAVLETGEADYAWNLQVEPPILDRWKPRAWASSVPSPATERILSTSPTPTRRWATSARSGTDDPNPHPFLSDPAVRNALSMAIDRNLIAEQLYGFGGEPTCNIMAGPPAVVSTTNDACLTQDIEGAKALLEAAAGSIATAMACARRMASSCASSSKPPPAPCARRRRR